MKIRKIGTYKSFFERRGSKFIRFSDEIVEKFEELAGPTKLETERIITMSKEEIIVQAMKEVEEYINKNIIPSFLFSYGV